MPFITAPETIETVFDYIIIGGGTTGLTVAARLTEIPTVSVLILEAGSRNLNDTLIEIPAQLGHTFGNPQYDWAFPIVQEQSRDNKNSTWVRGKGLGGTSSMNFYLWSKPPAKDVDAIEKLGNPGWNWEDYIKYSMKTETFHPPAKEQTARYPHTFNSTYRGTDGPVQITIPPHAHTIDKLYQETMVAKGVQPIEDPYGGNVTGTWIASSTLDPRTWTRSYSANSYLAPNLGRENLKVLTDAVVSRIILDDTPGVGLKSATSVQFVHRKVTYSVKVRKEAILSAGTIGSPQILELSGIGRPDVLQKIGVDVQVELPGVGEDVQEHVGIDMVFELDPNGGHETFDLLSDPVFAAKSKELHAQGKGLNRLGITSVSCLPHSCMGADCASDHIQKVKQEVRERERSGHMPSSLLEQLKLQISALKDESIPDFEILVLPGMFSSNEKPKQGKTYVTIAPFQAHPLSRGTIHAETTDPLAPPRIDPNYFSYESDFDIFVQYVKFVRQISNTEPLNSGLVREVEPGLGCKSDSDIKAFIRKNALGIFHAIGSCSMLPRDKQGVVDPTLKVYGTQNLRVTDISIVPIHIAAHMQATAYMIGEKAADIIKADME